MAVQALQYNPIESNWSETSNIAIIPCRKQHRSRNIILSSLATTIIRNQSSCSVHHFSGHIANSSELHTTPARIIPTELHRCCDNGQWVQCLLPYASASSLIIPSSIPVHAHCCIDEHNTFLSPCVMHCVLQECCMSDQQHQVPFFECCSD